jgi:hypothetical protein
MPLDPAIGDQLSTNALVSAQQGAALTALADRNLTQGLGVVNTSLIHQQGAVSDDPGLVASLQTASRAPVQGSNDLPK